MTTVEQSYARALYPRLAVLAVGLFAVATNGFLIAGILPSIAETLGVHASDVSYSISYYSIVVAVAAPAISILLPRISRTTLMASGLGLVAAGTVIAASAPDLLVFNAGRIVAALGGAALVPAATAAAAMLAPAQHRGRAIAFVAIGFTAAAAFGAPLGTAIASVGGWRLPLYGLAVIGALTAGAIALFVRGIPFGEPVTARRRFAVLANPRLLLTLATTLLVVSGFNVVYIFSSAITKPATGGSTSLLALLLLIAGVAGILGNIVAGRLIDRFGSRRIATLFFVAQIVLLSVLPLVVTNFVATCVVFALWGVAANASLLPVQDRLIAIDPATSAVSLSWYSTALYAGIALAPVLGAVILRLDNAELVPLAGAAAIAIALLVFHLGFMPVRSRQARPA